MELRPMVGVSIARPSSGALPLEWWLQALVVVCNVLPVLLVAAVVAYVSLMAIVATGLFSLFVGGVVIAFILGYAVFCLITAGALWRRRGWARFTAISVFLLYLPLHAWAGSVNLHQPSPTPAHLRGHSVYTHPAWETRTGRATWAIYRLLPVMNAVAMAHLVLRWRQFSRSAKPN